MACAQLGLDEVVLFTRPLFQRFECELADLFADAILGLIGGAIVGDGLLEGVGQFVKASQQVGTIREALLQRLARVENGLGFCQFIVHEPPQIYKTAPRFQY